MKKLFLITIVALLSTPALANYSCDISLNEVSVDEFTLPATNANGQSAINDRPVVIGADNYEVTIFSQFSNVGDHQLTSMSVKNKRTGLTVTANTQDLFLTTGNEKIAISCFEDLF